MLGDTILTPETASELQRQAHEQDRLPIWAVTWNPKDYPNKAVARPHFVGAGTQSALTAVLVAESLDALRTMLPKDLSRLERAPTDDPVIVEVWL